MKRRSVPSYSNRNNARFFLILFVVLVGAGLSIYAIVQGVQYLQHKADERAAAETARTKRIGELKDYSSTLPATWAEMEALHEELQIDDTTMGLITISWLKKTLKQFDDVSVALGDLYMEQMICETRNCLYENSTKIDEKRKTQKSLFDEYNSGAATIDPQKLEENKLFPELPSSLLL